jgi:hypothetical protein
MLEGHPTITGTSSSVTVTSWVQVAVLPEPSVTVQVTVVVPSRKVKGALLVIVDTEQLSLVTGVPRFTPVAPHDPASAVTETVAGQLIVGFCVSFTITVWLQEDVFPDPSVTVHVTIVVPRGNGFGALLTTERTEQLSPVRGVFRLTDPAVQRPWSAFTETAAGQLIVGLITSVTITV